MTWSVPDSYDTQRPDPLDDPLTGDTGPEDLGDRDQETRDDEVRQRIDDLLDGVGNPRSDVTTVIGTPRVVPIDLADFDPEAFLDGEDVDDLPASPFDGDAHLLQPRARSWTPPVPTAGPSDEPEPW